jgi:hypothetical protein
MLAVQHRLSLAPPRVRSCRRAFCPSVISHRYRLPHDVRDRLTTVLQPFRNREAAYALAVFLARFWSVPGRVSGSFYITREILADHAELGLTEARVRGATRTLEEVGFLDRALTAGSAFKRAALCRGDKMIRHRKPIRFVFGAEFAPLFIAANDRARAAAGRRSGIGKSSGADNARRPSTASAAVRINSPVKQERSGSQVINRRDKERASPSNGIPASASASDANLEAALQRLKEGFRLAEPGRTGGGS